MSFMEFLGFLITVGGVIFILIQHAWENYQKRKNPEMEGNKEVLRDFLKSLDVDLDSEPEPLPKPMPPVHKEIPKKKIIPPKSPIKEELRQTLKEKDAYALAHREKMARGRKLIGSLKTPQEMVLLHTILGPPKGL